MRGMGLRCAYYNSGSFAFDAGREAGARIVGWVGPDDPTIRNDLPASIVNVVEPYAQNLADKLLTIWPGVIDSPAWVLPKSHWHFELDHHGRDWLPGAIERIGVDPGLLLSRTNAAAIEFVADERDLLQAFVTTLLTSLTLTDFAILFPHFSHRVTIHHHKQLWWQTEDDALAVKLSKPQWKQEIPR